MPDLRDKRVFITGGAGFIGANLVRELLSRGAKVHVLVRPKTNLWRLKDIVSRIVLHRADLIQGRKLKGIVQKIRPDIIYHMAMYGGWPGDEKTKKRVLSSCLTGTLNLLEGIEPIDYERFI
ncbi:MAG: NAD-dependent epimerase/dehydratase family protein, partial [Planctomycetota bacterium]